MHLHRTTSQKFLLHGKEGIQSLYQLPYMVYEARSTQMEGTAQQRLTERFEVGQLYRTAQRLKLC